MSGYCAPHDPITATVVTCRICGEDAHPCDAEWLTATLIIVQFRPACAHVAEHVQVVDVTQLGPAAPRCIASTRTRSQCKNRPLHDSEFCAVHDPDRQRVV